MRGIAGFALLSSVALAASALVPHAQAAPGSLASARQKAAALEARIEAQGERLSIADEQFNSARYRRSILLNDLTKTKAHLIAAEKSYGRLRDQLGSRARSLYMHPGAPFAAWLSMRSIDQVGRQRVLSNAVLTADSALVSATDAARREIRAKERLLGVLSTDAEQSERLLAAQRGDLAVQLGTQRSLLANVKGDIARIIAADRERRLAEARRNGTASTGHALGTAAALSEGALPPPPPPKPGASRALAVARAQIGKPYKWGAAGPDSFDCSGLTMYAWAAAGVQLVHFAASQYDMLPKVRRTQLKPGDLVFFGSPIHHEGIYEGGGIMIDAPQTGEDVRRDSIYRADYAGSSRP